MNLSHTIALLAEGEASQESAPGLGPMLFPLILIVFIWYFLILRPQGRERKDREAALANLKKNDKVATFSGIIGTVVSFSNDGKEVTLRSEDAKFRVLRSAIQGVLADTPDEASKPPTNPS